MKDKVFFFVFSLLTNSIQRSISYFMFPNIWAIMKSGHLKKERENESVCVYERERERERMFPFLM